MPTFHVRTSITLIVDADNKRQARILTRLMIRHHFTPGETLLEEPDKFSVKEASNGDEQPKEHLHPVQDRKESHPKQ